MTSNRPLNSLDPLSWFIYLCHFFQLQFNDQTVLLKQKKYFICTMSLNGFLDFLITAFAESLSADLDIAIIMLAKNVFEINPNSVQI